MGETEKPVLTNDSMRVYVEDDVGTARLPRVGLEGVAWKRPEAADAVLFGFVSDLDGMYGVLCNASAFLVAEWFGDEDERPLEERLLMRLDGPVEAWFEIPNAVPFPHEDRAALYWKMHFTCRLHLQGVA